MVLSIFETTNPKESPMSGMEEIDKHKLSAYSPPARLIVVRCIRVLGAAREGLCPGVF